MKIGILRTDTVRPEYASNHGQYPEMFARLLRAVDPSLEFITYDVEHGEFPDDIDEVDAYLITGSKASVYDELAWIKPLQDFVVELHRAKKKTIGVCFGHQLIAQALGGKTQKADAGWGVGVHPARWHKPVDWAGEANGEFKLLVSHQDQVTRAAKGAEVLAGSEFCPIAITQLENHMLTFQGHPEFPKDYSKDLMNLRRHIIGEDIYAAGIASLQESINEQDAARWIVNFLNA